MTDAIEIIREFVRLANDDAENPEEWDDKLDAALANAEEFLRVNGWCPACAERQLTEGRCGSPINSCGFNEEMFR